MAGFKVKFLRGSQAANDIYVGPAGEITIDVVNWRIRLHDGQTPGGVVIPNREDLDNAIAEYASGAGNGVEVIDLLTSTDTTAALSAAQGKILKDLIDSLEVGGTTPALPEDMVPGTTINDKAVTPQGLETFLSTQLGITYDETLGDWVNDEGAGTAV